MKGQSPIRELLGLELSKLVAGSRSTDVTTLRALDLVRIQNLIDKLDTIEAPDDTVSHPWTPRQQKILKRVGKRPVASAATDVRSQLRDVVASEIGKMLALARLSEWPTLKSADLVSLEALVDHQVQAEAFEVDLSLLSLDDLRELVGLKRTPIPASYRAKMAAMRLAVAAGGHPSECETFADDPSPHEEKGISEAPSPSPVRSRKRQGRR